MRLCLHLTETAIVPYVGKRKPDHLRAIRLHDIEVKKEGDQVFENFPGLKTALEDAYMQHALGSYSGFDDLQVQSRKK